MSENKPAPKKEVYSAKDTSYEEITEKKTSKLGYLLLIMMVIFVISVGETIFSDLRRMVDRPLGPTLCVSLAVQTDSFMDADCPRYGAEWNEIDKEFELNAQYLVLKPKLIQIASLNERIQNNRRNIERSEYMIRERKEDYDLGLQEKMAGESAPLINNDTTRQSITNASNEISALRNEITSLTREKTALVSTISEELKNLEASYDAAYEGYKTQMAWYRVKVFLLTLLFVLPFFVLSVWWYLRLKSKNSPYTIILTAATTAFSILFLQVVGVFLYEILPKTWLTRIFEFFLQLPFLRYILYYGSVILIIAIFGGIVYWIQKKVFDPVKVAVRRIKDKKCPGCSFLLDTHQDFCPNCGLQLKEKCAHCGKLKIRYLSHCPHCGEE